MKKTQSLFPNPKQDSLEDRIKMLGKFVNYMLPIPSLLLLCHSIYKSKSGEDYSSFNLGFTLGSVVIFLPMTLFIYRVFFPDILATKAIFAANRKKMVLSLIVIAMCAIVGEILHRHYIQKGQALYDEARAKSKVK
jgi:hypothetical protein